MMDLIGDGDYQVEIQTEVGWTDRYKLYVHFKGETILRLGRLTERQIDVHGFRRTG